MLRSFEPTDRRANACCNRLELTRAIGRKATERALRHSVAPALALVFALFADGAALAQTVPAQVDAEAIGSDRDIIVTARRVEERLQDVPVAITAFSGESLRERQIESAADLQYNVPSLSVTPVTGGNGANYGLRGQRQGIGNTQGVVTYFAEIPVSASSTYRQTFDMGSIQVLKGPQGTLFGANSNGGAILFGPKKPSDVFEGEVQAAIGSYSLRDLTAVINLPLAEWASLRLAGNFVRRDGYTKNLNPCPRQYDPVGPGNPPSALTISPNCGRRGAQDDDRHESWRTSLALTPSDNLRNDLVYWGIHENRIGGSWVPFRFAGALQGALFGPPLNGLLGFPTAASVLAEQRQNGIRKVFTDEQSYYFREDGISNITTFDLDGQIKLKNIYGFRSTTESQHRDQDGSRLPFVQQDAYRGGRTKTHTNEFQILGSFLEDQIDVVAGGYLLRQDDPGSRVFTYLYQLTSAQQATVRALGASALIIPNPVNGITPAARTKTKTDALFANVNINLSALVPGLRFSGGYRYTWDEARTWSPQNLVGGVCVDVSTRNYVVDRTSCTRLARLKSKGGNYSATLQYNVTEDTMIYMSTRHGFKPGGANQVSVVDPNFFFYKPETITDYEVGLKSEFQLGDLRVRANIAAYTSTYRNVQRSEVVQQSSGLTAITTFNAQKATIRGVEPELNFAIGRNLNLSVFYSYLDAKFDKYELAGPGGTIIDKTGTDFSAVSKHSVGATLVYRFPLPERIGGVTATGNFYYRSSQTFADSNLNQPADITAPGYSIFNARIDWHLPDTSLTLSAAATNIFDKNYAVGGGDFTSSIVGYANSIYGPPRMLRFEATFRF